MIDIKVKPQHGKGPGINIHGKYVTEAVHQIFSRHMGSNLTTCPSYKARTKCSAFFQGGFDAPKDNWVFIEFWGTDWLDFTALLKRDLNGLDNNGVPLPMIVKIEPTDENRVYIKDITHFYDIPYTISDDGQFVTLSPKDGTEVVYLNELFEDSHNKEWKVERQRIEISLDPYSWKEKGSLGVAEMITEDTGVPFVWKLGDDLRFFPTNMEEFHKVQDLLDDFLIVHKVEKFGY